MIVEAAVRAGEEDPLYSSLWVPTPEIEVPGPSEDQVRDFNVDGPIDPFMFQSGALVFGDGSVVEPKCELLARG
eukprot:5109240-Pyramimonas_sp.AAC.1